MTDLEDLYPLSPTQQGMLFHALQSPESRMYVEQLVWEVEGELDTEAMRRAWQCLVDRHAVLRTSLAWEQTQAPLQAVHRSAELSYLAFDFSSAGAEEQRQQVDAVLSGYRNYGFDLRTAPLMNVAVVRLAPQRHWMVWTFHHVVIDGWSIGQVREELLDAYHAIAAGAAPPEPVRRRAYRNFIAWLGQLDPAPGERFWRRELAGVAEPARLPMLAGRADTGSGYRELLLDVAETTALDDAARGYRVTTNTLVQGVWALLLARYTGRAEAIFGVTSAGRPLSLAGAHDMIGMFLTTTPLRVAVAASDTVAPWLRSIQARQYEVREHEHTPLTQIQSWTDLPPGEPLFDSVVVFENYPDSESAAGPGRLRLRMVDFVDRTNYPLTLTVLPKERFGFRLTYDRSRLDDAAADRLVAHLRQLLAGFAADGGARVVDLPMLTEQERAVWRQWNATSRPLPAASCVPDVIRAQAAGTPDAVAVQDGDRTLTYRELVDRAGALAARLRAVGVAPGGLAGVCLDRTVDTVVALLAVLDCGAGYVPLDPEYPRRRLAFMIEHSGPAAVLATSATADRAAGPAPLVLLDEDSWSHPAPGPARLGAATQDGTAYVIYTSGSTGQPKGVQIGHRALLNLLTSLTERIGMTGEDTLLAVTSLSFDIAAFELLGPLLVGGRVVLAARDVAADGGRLAGLLHECGATVMQATPTTWKLLLGAGWAGKRDLTALCGGEPLAGELAGRLLDRSGALWNLYGPTETTIWSAAHRVDAATDPVPLGRPLANTEIVVLDRHGQLQPPGVLGELYVGGAGLAAGYWRDEARTAASFVAIGGRRLYRTGDVGRLRPDGLLEFHGRSDDQVKVRGHRIELGEVESAMARHPGVAECVAAARTNADGERMLVGYVVPADGALTPEALRAFLTRELPAQAVPSWFELMPTLPTTPNGKVDRAALPRPGGRRGDDGPAFAAPTTDVERILAEVWAEVLGLDRVGIDDNFFTIGGDSLRTFHVMAAADRRGVKITIGELFERPTVRELAAVAAAKRADSGVPALTRREHPGPVPVTYAQEMMLALNALTPGSTAYLPRIGFDIRGPLDVPALRRAIDTLVARHAAFRIRLHRGEGGRVRQDLGPVEPARVLTFDLSQVAAERVDDAVDGIVAEHVAVAHDLFAGEPLYRVVLIKLPDRHLLLISMDHLVGDGWSLLVVARELHELYRAECDGDRPALPELPIEYFDFAVWQREYLVGERLQRYRDFWRNRLSGVPAMQIPSSRPPAAVPNMRGVVAPLRVEPSVTARLTELGRAQQTTLFATMIAAIQAVIWTRVDEDIVTIAAPVGGRKYPEIENVVGCFVYGMLFPTDMSGDPTFRELVDRVRDAARDTYDHQDMPLEELGKIREFSTVNGMGTQGVALELTTSVESVELPGVGADVRMIPWWPRRRGTVDMPPVDMYFNLHTSPVDGGLEGECVYNPVRFDEPDIAALLGQLTATLRAVADDPDQTLAELRELAMSRS